MSVINFPGRHPASAPKCADDELAAVAGKLRTGEAREVIVLVANRDGSISELRIAAPSTFPQALPA